MRIRITPATVVASAALVVALSGTAMAANGGSFLLGRTNTATANTVIKNPNGTTLVLDSKKGIAPLSVNGNKVKVPSLNADLLDGQDSAKFQLRVAGQCGSTAISAVSATGSVTCLSAQHLFFTSGTADFAIPAGITKIEIMARGAGGSGGSSLTALGRGGGGGQGGRTDTLVSVSAGQRYAVTVGAGGLAPAGADADGNAGGKSAVILTPSADATKFAAVANGGAAGTAATVCTGAGGSGGNGGTAPGPTGPGALGLTMSVGSAGSDAGTHADCATGGIGGGTGYAGAGGNGAQPDATPAASAQPGSPGLVEVTLLN